MTQAKKQRGPTVVITGAGSGLGRELALGFSAKGYRVFGTAQSANETAEFQSNAPIATTSNSSLLLFSPLQQMQLIQNRNYDDHAGYNYYHMAFAYNGKEISQKLSYAHFLPLTGNNQSHQVKVVVNYSVSEPSIVNQNMNAIMRVYSSNGTLIKHIFGQNKYLM
jgi:hypothetical protein